MKNNPATGIRFTGRKKPKAFTVWLFEYSDPWLGVLGSEEKSFRTIREAKQHASSAIGRRYKGGVISSVGVTDMRDKKNPEHEVFELQAYIENDQNLYGMLRSFAKNYSKKFAKGKYDPALARKGLKRLISSGYAAYKKEFGPSAMLITASDRVEIADKLATQIEDEMGYTSYENPRDYSPKLSTLTINKGKRKKVRSLIGTGNPVHYPHDTGRGRPRKGRGRPKKLEALREKVFAAGTRGRPRMPEYWIADLFHNDVMVNTLIGHGTRQSANAQAASLVGKTTKDNMTGKVVKIHRLELSGPYDTKPELDWPRT